MSSMLRVPGQPLLVFCKVKIIIREREVQRECWGHQLWGLYTTRAPRPFFDYGSR